MGEVLAGHDEKLDRPVAIKRLRADLVVTEERRRRLEVEAQLNARLSHPNVVQVYDFVSSDGLDHIVTEYVDGQALSEVVRGERPTFERALDFLAAVARGLEAAHRRGIVHRDLKLENILVSREGQTKIADFGIAALRESAHLVPTRSGTIATMSPEQRAGESEDARSDLFALGVMAYELLSGASPFASSVAGEHRPLLEIVSSIPSELSALIDRLLEPERDLRLVTAEEVSAQLTALASRFKRRVEAPARPSMHFSQVAALSLRATLPTGDIEQTAIRTADWQRRVREIAMRYQAYLVAPAGLEALVCVGYPRAYGDNCATAARLVSELNTSGMRVAAGIDAGKIAIFDQPGGAIVAGPPIEGATAAGRRAPPGVVQVTPAVHRTLARSYRLTPTEAEVTDGQRSAVLYRLEDPLEWEANGPLVSSPFVGRREIVTQLKTAEERAFSGAIDTPQGPVVHGLVIHGPSGVGKSRLLRSFLDQAEAARVVFARGSERLRAEPFGAVRRLLSDLPELRAPTRESVLALLATLGWTDAERCAAITGVIGVADARDGAVLAGIASKVAGEVGRFLAALLASDRTLLAVEDLHWIDASSLEVLRAFAVAAEGRPVLAVCTSRPGGEKLLPDFVAHELGPLETRDAMRLAETASRGWVLPPRVAGAIVERAGGMPLLVEELSHFVAKRAGETSAIDLAELPTSFAAAIMARVAELDPEVKRVAGLASAIDNEIDEDLLLAVTELPAEELHRHVETLAREGLFHSLGFGVRAYAFRDALTRESIYEAQDANTRLENHRTILRRIEASFPSWKDERPALVARQCEGAGDRERAATMFEAAAKRAEAQWSPAVAQELSARAQAVLG